MAGVYPRGPSGQGLLEPGERLVVQGGAVAREAAEDEMFNRRRARQRIRRGFDRNARCALGGKAIHAGGDSGKSDGGKSVRRGKLDRAAIAGGQQVALAIAAAIPY